ncbi:MAG: hypothetical protein ACRDRV_21535 [Pseudonocardiaceae bacterium]
MRHSNGSSNSKITAQRDIDIDYVEYAGMPHGWMLQRIPEGGRALAQITGILQKSQT